MEKIYHIYAKDKCLYHSLKQEEFENTWNTLKNMVGLMKTDYSVEDLNFIELPLSLNGHIMNKSMDPPGSPSY